MGDFPKSSNNTAPPATDRSVRATEPLQLLVLCLALQNHSRDLICEEAKDEPGQQERGAFKREGLELVKQLSDHKGSQAIGGLLQQKCF
jgi:hypothetical protein